MPTKIVLITALASLLTLSGALAQTDATPAPMDTAAPAAPAAAPPAAAPADAAPASGAANAALVPGTPRDVRLQCRQQGVAQGLRGPALKAAVNDCFAKARPDIVVGQKCRAQAKTQGLTGQPFWAYVRSCKTKAM